MGFADFFRQPDIHAGVQEYLRTPGALLLDVRTPAEYRCGHIPGSINVPLQHLNSGEEIIDNEDTPVFLYCQSGARSRQAAAVLKGLGYSSVRNIGGISAWHGKVE